MQDHNDVTEFQPIQQKYFLHEKDKYLNDPFAYGLQEYFGLYRKRAIWNSLLSLFFLALMIPSIVLQSDYVEFDVPSDGILFTMPNTLEPPISVQIFSKSSILLLDVVLYIDGHTIHEFTIQDQLSTKYRFSSNKDFTFTVRLMAQFSFVPTSYLIIVVLMLVLSLLYLMFQYARYRTL